MYSFTLCIFLASASALDRVNLGTAADFAILTKTGITTTVGSTVLGDLGTSPISLTAITGFSLIQDFTGTFSTSSLVTGRVYGADQTAPMPSKLTIAVGDMGTAYTDAAGRTNPDFTEDGTGDINGLTLVPGLYKWSTTVGFTNSVTFDGGATDVWILQIDGDVVVGSGAQAYLAGGALAENIFWQVSGLVNVGTTAHLQGVFLVKTMMAFKTGSWLSGAALAQTAVTLDAATIVKKSSDGTSTRYLRSTPT
jgi:hypothetical protein